MAIDLFGEVPVTLDDIERWLDVIVKFDCAPFRVERYVLSYNVVDKIRAAKLAGTWEGWHDGRNEFQSVDDLDRRIRLRRTFGFERYVDSISSQ